MRIPSSQLDKFRHFIQRYGQKFTVNTPSKNEFGEPSYETEAVQILGVYHESSSGYMEKNSTDGTTIRSKAAPQVLAFWGEAQNLSHESQISFNGKIYKINGIRNVAEANTLAEISLEEVQQG